MAKVKLSENLFLEVAELNRFRQFVDDDGWKRAFKSVVKSYGIVQDENNTYFKVTRIDDTHVKINKGLAFNTSMEAIVSEQDETRALVVGTKRWLVLSRATRNYETGTVSVTADGTLTGTNTEFTKVLRGQPNFPTKIKFLNSPQNAGEYEVVQVNSDTSAVISGALTAQSGLQYCVMGTFTPGFAAAEANKLIYEFDHYAISEVASATKPTVTADEYILASCEWTNGVLTVVDERAPYMFNNEYNINQNSAEGINPLTSLMKSTLVSGINAYNTKSADIELILQHGYSVISYQIAVSGSANLFTITNGYNNYLGNSPIPNDSVRGWLLVNRVNMKAAYITRNEISTTNSVLYLETIPDGFDTENADFVVVPNFSEIEYEVKLNSSVEQPSVPQGMAVNVPFTFRNTISNPFTRARFYAKFPIAGGGANTVTISMRYRLIDAEGTIYPYHNLAIATFTNVLGNTETLSNSSFTVNMQNLEPVAPQQNYS